MQVMMRSLLATSCNLVPQGFLENHRVDSTGIPEVQPFVPLCQPVSHQLWWAEWKSLRWDKGLVYNLYVYVLSHVQLFVTPWIVVHPSPLSTGLSW